jgi:DNA modification methylase
MTAVVIQADARNLPLPDRSVDLIVTSPPYFALRSYQDGGEHYAGQIGAEPTPQAFLASLWECTAEWLRVLKPSGSLWVNLGDKYAGKGGGAQGATSQRVGRSNVVEQIKPTVTGTRDKSLIGIPWRYAIGCIDELGLILRAEVIWSKPNGLPESVTDRVRRSHEQWFHLVQQPRYFSAVDEIREPHALQSIARTHRNRFAPDLSQNGVGSPNTLNPADACNPLGKLPGSVWTVPTEPLRVPDDLGIDHFAAFPTEWPRRIIQGWSPRGICVECGEGRRPKVASVGLDMDRPQARRAHELAESAGLTEEHFAALLSVGVSDTGRGAATQSGTGKNTAEVYSLANEARKALGGYSREYLLRRPTALRDVCDCPTTTAPTRPSVILDPFGGTGTTALVADALGRTGISVDLSHDYSRLARWRTTDPNERARAMRIDKPPVQVSGQGNLFGALA